MRKKLFGLAAGGVVLGIVLLAGWLMNRPTRKNGTTYLDGTGYVGIAERDGRLFSVDTSGCVYEIDWDTGGKTAQGKIPAEERWITDEAFQNVYYMEDSTLIRYDLVTEEATALRRMNYCQRLLGATDQGLIYSRDGGKLVLLNLDTLEEVSIQKGAENQWLLLDEDTAYYVYAHEGPREQDKYTDIVAWNLKTGEEAILAHYARTRESPRAAYQVEEGSLAMVGEKVYFFLYEEDNVIALYSVSKEGGEEPEAVSLGSQTIEPWRVGGSGFLCLVGEEESVLYSQGEAGQLTPLLRVGSQIAQVNLVRQGEHCAVFYWDVLKNQSRILLTTLENQLRYRTKGMEKPASIEGYLSAWCR